MNSQQRASHTRICICADDFGLSDGVNTAVLTLAAQRRVQATSCMVFAPAWAGGAEALRQLDGHAMDIGLHLDFTQYPSQAGMRHSLRDLIIKSTLGLLDPTAVRTEVVAQFDAFERAMGRLPDFIDGHQHVHQLPCIREALVAEIKHRYGPQPRPWVRVSQGLPFGIDARTSGWRGALKSAVIGQLGAGALSGQLRKAGIERNARLLGIYGFQAHEEHYKRQLVAWLNSAADADLLMCHPSTQTTLDDPIAAARAIEYSVLIRDGLTRLVRDHGVQLLPMRQILHTPH